MDGRLPSVPSSSSSSSSASKTAAELAAKKETVNMAQRHPIGETGESSLRIPSSSSFAAQQQEAFGPEPHGFPQGPSAASIGFVDRGPHTAAYPGRFVLFPVSLLRSSQRRSGQKTEQYFRDSHGFPGGGGMLVDPEHPIFNRQGQHPAFPPHTGDQRFLPP